MTFLEEVKELAARLLGLCLKEEEGAVIWRAPEAAPPVLQASPF